MVDKESPNPVPPRFTAEVAFPPYTYVPGRSPHPKSDPAGHAYGRSESPVQPVDEATWSRSRAYLHAIDLFNYGFYWEAHEAWEALWHACGRRGATADLLKGLIKLAAAGVKVREGRPTGVASHARRAAELFRAAATGSPRAELGLDVDELTKFANFVATSPPELRTDGTATIAPGAAVPVFSFRLMPRFDRASE